MKLELSGRIHPPIHTSPTPPPSSTGLQSPTTTAPVSAPVDRTTFHSGSATVNSLVANALAAPEIRQDKVDTIRQSLSNGTYKFDAGATADAMISSSEQS